MFKLENVSKIYETQNESVTAADSINIEFESKGLYVILGKSGCGKTTLLNMLAGLTASSSGKISFEGHEINLYSENDLDEFRNLKIGIIFQQYNLISKMNVYDNLKIVLSIQDSNNTQINEKINSVLQAVGLSGYEKRRISQLSGGEQQRIAIARALLKEPDVILADEPTGNLDGATGERIMETLSEISKNKLVIMVTHDKKSAYKYADKIIFMRDGRIEKVKKSNAGKNIYSLKIKKGDKLETINATSGEIAELVREALEDEEGDISLFDIRLTEPDTKKADIPDSSEKTAAQQNKSVRRLDNKTIFRTAGIFLNKKTRLLFTTLILALSTVLMYFAGYVTFYNKNEVILKYLNQYNPEILSCNTEISYENDFFEIKDNTVTKGKLLYEKVQNSLEDYSHFAKAVLNQGLFVDDYNMFMDATFLFLNNPEDFPELVYGTYPSSRDEIVITDCLAEILGLSTGDTINDFIRDRKISGIAKTDYIGQNIINKLNENVFDSFFDYKCRYKYLVAYMYSDVLDEETENCVNLRIKASNFLNQGEKIYFSSYMDYCSCDKIKSEDLIAGRLPSAPNEILISSDLAEMYNLTESFNEDTYYFRDIYADKYNGYYSDNLNMYGYFKEGIVITGIVKYFDSRYNCDVYINKTIWEQIKKDYYQYYYADIVVIPDRNNYKQLTKLSYENGIQYEEPGLLEIQDFHNKTVQLKPVFYMILAALLIINVFTIATYISISINENVRNIGILRSIGVRLNECSRIFRFEFVIIFILSVIIGFAGICIATYRINSLFMQNLPDNKFNILIINAVIFVIVLFIEFAVGSASLIIPVNSMKKKPLADTLHTL